MLPEIRLSDHFILPTYIVYLSLLFSGLVLLLPKYAQSRRLEPKEALNISLVLMVVGFLGARLFHVFYEEWPLYREQPERILYFWLGGFVFFGGAIPATLAAWIYLKLNHLPFPEWSDFFAPLGALGYGLGRLSCWFSGCCYGTTCDLPWAIDGRHPTQLYAVLWELIVFGLLISQRHRIVSRLHLGGVFWTWVFLHALGRILMEGLRADFRGPLIFGFSVSAVLCIVLLLLSGGKIAFQLLRKY